jgi:predicted chitinase
MAKTSPTPENSPVIQEDSDTLVKSIAKNFLRLPEISKNLQIANIHLSKMVKKTGARPTTYGDVALAEAEEKIKAEKELTAKKVTPIKEEGGIGLGKGILAGALLKTIGPKKVLKLASIVLKIKTFFSAANILKVIGKFGLPLMIFSALYDGFTAAFDMWKETGSIWESFKAGVGGVVEWLTFGLIDKQMVSDFYDWGLGAIEQVLTSVAKFFGFGDLFTEKFAKVKEFLGVGIKPKSKTFTIEEPPSEKREVKKEPEVKKPVEKAPAEAPAAPAPAAPAPTPVGAEPTPTKAPTVAPEAKPSEAKPVKIGESSGKDAMIKAMDSNKITDPTARAAIMAQVGHESGNFTTLSENLNYKPATLLKIFPKYFKSPEEAQQTSSQGPAAIANRVYGGRMGNTEPGDGFKYRGRGFIQLTGKSNYKKFGVDGNPDSVADINVAADTAIGYMKQYKGDWGDVKAVTKFVNGGYIGLEDRAKHFQAYLNDPKITQVTGGQTAASGGSVASASSDVAAGQRQQAKPSTPMVVNNTTINNNTSTRTTLPVQAKDNNSTNNMLMARAA